MARIAAAQDAPEIDRLLHHQLLAWTKGHATAVVRGDEAQQSGVAAWHRLRRRFGPGEGEALVDVATYKWQGPPEQAWRAFCNKVQGAAGALPERLLEKWAIEGLCKVGLHSVVETLRMRAPQPWADLRDQVDKYLSIYRITGGPAKQVAKQNGPVPMDIGSMVHQQAGQKDGEAKEGDGKGKGNGKGNASGKGKQVRTSWAKQKCSKCGKPGHPPFRCPSLASKDRTPPGIVCHECGGVGHIARECPTAQRRKAATAIDCVQDGSPPVGDSPPF